MWMEVERRARDFCFHFVARAPEFNSPSTFHLCSGLDGRGRKWVEIERRRFLLQQQQLMATSKWFHCGQLDGVVRGILIWNRVFRTATTVSMALTSQTVFIPPPPSRRPLPPAAPLLRPVKERSDRVGSWVGQCCDSLLGLSKEDG
jgi:hypothetical protein